MSHFYDLEKPRTFGVMNQILQDTGKDHFKTHKTGNRVIRSRNRVNNLWKKIVILLCHIAEAILLVLFGPSDVFAVFCICLHIEMACGGMFH